MHVFFIRHGLTEENKEGRIQGHLPGKLLVPETEKYLSAVTPLLRHQPISRLVSSDLARAVETRKMLSRFLMRGNLPEMESKLLRERSFGKYDGKLWSEVPEDIRAGRHDLHFNHRSYGGESDDDIQNRVRKFLPWIANENGPKKNACCVTHAGWLRQLACINRDTSVPQEWFDRVVIFDVTLDQNGNMLTLKPITIDADIDFSEE